MSAGLVVDTSALVAIMWREPGCEGLSRVLGAAEAALATSAALLELGMVIEGRQSGAVGKAQQAMKDGAIEVVPFTEGLASRAIDAWRRFGKGRHPAGLNFGDCFTYALAEERDLPILCVGSDFRRTGWPVVDGS